MTALLVVIYLAFIALGLPDSSLGAIWPSVYPELGVGVARAGVLSMIIASGTILSSLASGRLLRHFRAGSITAVSTAMTALAILAISRARGFGAMCLWGIPLGLGAGSVDAALNHYVALHYSSRHMSWLHCFWGLGACAGPRLLSAALGGGMGWRGSYGLLGLTQLALALILFVSLPLWRRAAQKDAAAAAPSDVSMREALRVPGVGATLLGFFCYCGMETGAGLWASSYLTLCRGLDAATAAGWAALFYAGITLGRFLCGFISDKLGDQRTIRLGQSVLAVGVAALLLPLGRASAFAGLLLVGLGCAPVYPCLIHATPARFGAGNAQALIGMQMASAYVGSTFMPPLFGLIAGAWGAQWYPLYLAVFALGMVAAIERTNRAVKNGA